MFKLITDIKHILLYEKIELSETVCRIIAEFQFSGYMYEESPKI